MIIVMTTAPDAVEAEELARKMTEAKLAACVQILPQIVSVYIWKNEIQKEAEYLLLIKTLDEKYSELEKFIRENHSYETPEIIAVKAENFSDAYFNWMKSVI